MTVLTVPIPERFDKTILKSDAFIYDSIRRRTEKVGPAGNGLLKRRINETSSV